MRLRLREGCSAGIRSVDGGMLRDGERSGTYLSMVESGRETDRGSG